MKERLPFSLSLSLSNLYFDTLLLWYEQQLDDTFIRLFGVNFRFSWAFRKHFCARKSREVFDPCSISESSSSDFSRATTCGTFRLTTNDLKKEGGKLHLKWDGCQSGWLLWHWHAGDAVAPSFSLPTSFVDEQRLKATAVWNEEGTGAGDWVVERNGARRRRSLR